jgi:hypothetical protein
VKQTKLPERNDILKMVQRELHAQGREDVKVEVAFVVNLDAGDPVIVNTIIDPHQPFPRWKCRQFIESIIERIEEMEKKQGASPETTVSSNLVQTQQAVPVAL